MSKTLRFTPFPPEAQAIIDRYFVEGASDPEEEDPIRPLVDKLAGDYSGGDFGIRRIDVAAGVLIHGLVEGPKLSWDFVDEEGQLRNTRDLEIPDERRFTLMSKILLTINWADSGPGMSWPEQYRLTWVPSPERFVVTAALDSDDAHGYMDVALGHFGVSKARAINKVGAILKRWWKVQAAEGMQEPWDSAEGGLVEEAVATKWRASVWGRRGGSSYWSE
ncbi:MAG: hypothetical protein IPN47_19100 [Gemmatimonadetes bacterium]|nr:hypothetical protein [Gemmatimonadota bacterium]